ncbi:hypothetical protein F8388_022180 [Cannabis sativa]|uniref:TF-B3 domain-containing protein n=1 Tax=Cannabis sativa TaxID=3483 RepID=A0A7J6G7Y6_CANSA|nr:hypothetical protein F8388_022180 [Cannabis sativa]
MELVFFNKSRDQPEKQRLQCMTKREKISILELLALPQKFGMLFGDSLASSVSLVLPYRQLLIFDYRGNSNFDVFITDDSSCEIDYTHFPFYSDEKKNGKSPVINLTSSEECSSNSDYKGNSMVSEESEDETTRKMKRRNEGAYNTYRDTKAYKQASQFYTNNPSFKRIIRANNNRQYNLRLPDSFVTNHVGSKTQMVSLKVGSRKWDVKLLKCKASFFFTKGWAAFLEANSLNTGDACVFEFQPREPTSLKCTVATTAYGDEMMLCWRSFSTVTPKFEVKLELLLST